MMGTAEFAAVFAALVAAVTVVKWLMDRGKQDGRADSTAKDAKEAKADAMAATAKAEFALQKLSEFKTEVAREYVNVASMDKFEKRITDEVHRSSDDISGRVEALNRTLIEVLAPLAVAGLSKPPDNKRKPIA